MPKSTSSLLNKYLVALDGEKNTVTFDAAVWKAIDDLLAQEVKRVIGEDEVEMLGNTHKHAAIIRNQLRAEQRRKAGLV